MVGYISFFKPALDFRTWRCIVCTIFYVHLNIAIPDPFEVTAGRTETKTTAEFSGKGIELGGNLVLNQDHDGILSDVISGSGSLAKYGSGNVTLAADNTYTGKTEINGGSLTGTTRSFGSGDGGIFFNRKQIETTDTVKTQDATDETSLIIDQNFDGDWNHKLFNSRTAETKSKVIKKGSGTVTMTINSYMFDDIASLADEDFQTRLGYGVRLPDEFHIEEGALRAGGKYVLGFANELA